MNMDSNVENSWDEKIPSKRFGLIHVSKNFGYVRDVATARAVKVIGIFYANNPPIPTN